MQLIFWEDGGLIIHIENDGSPQWFHQFSNSSRLRKEAYVDDHKLNA